MLSNAYFLAKFGFDTAENEPAKNLQNFSNNFPNFPNFEFGFGQVCLGEAPISEQGKGAIEQGRVERSVGLILIS